METQKNRSKTVSQNTKQEIESFKKGFDFVADHVVITDADGNILYANKAVEQNTGFSIKEILGKNPGSLWGGTMLPEFYQHMWHVIKQEKKPFVGEVQNRKKDGTEYWQELHISPVLDQHNNVKFFIGIEPNITDQKEKENFRKSFLANLGQQVQQPLNASSWLLQWILANSKLTEEEKRSLEQIYRHNEKLVDLFDNLMELSDATKSVGKKTT